MKKIHILIYFLGLLIFPVSAQYITNRGSYIGGASYISTSRLQVVKTRDHYASTISISLDYIHIEGNGYAMSSGDNYMIQMNFYERNIGQTILLKCENGNVIELKTRSIQHSPFVQVYNMKPEKVEEIIKGRIVKIRILTPKGYVDREVKDNKFSDSVRRCYYLLKKTRQEELNTQNDFKKNF